MNPTISKLLLLTLGSSMSLFLQSKLPLQAQKPTAEEEYYLPYQPVALPKDAPRWMEQLIDVKNINYFEMTDSFNLYLKNNPEARRKTPLNKAIINYFRRWQSAYYPYVDKTGRINIPRQSDYRDFVHRINAQSAAQRKAPRLAPVEPGSQWRVISPLKTYDKTSKKAYPAQANIQRFDVARTNNNVLYCGSQTGMIFKTTDKGQHWTPCAGSHYMGGEVNTLEISYTNSDKLIVGAGPFLWITEDGGESWQDITPAQLRTASVMVRDAVFHPTNDSEILLATDRGVYKSTDNGKNWYQILDGLCFDLKYKPGDAQTIYAFARVGGAVGLHVSKNSGASFEARSPKTTYALASGRIGVSEAPNGENYIYVVACKQDHGYRSYTSPFYSGTPVLFKSTDEGASWINYDNISTKMERYELQGGQGYYDMVINVSNKNPEQLLFGLLFLYRSDDGGQTITNKGGYYGPFDLHPDMQDLKVVGNDTWLSTDGGLILSTDFFGTTAETRVNGIYASEFFNYDQGWNEDVIVGGRNHNGNMSTYDRYNGAAIFMGGGEVATGHVFLSNPMKVAFSDADNVIMPKDWRDEFVPFLTYWTYPNESYQFGQALEFDPRYAQSFQLIKGNYEGDHKSLWKTTDDGANFVELHQFERPISSHSISRSNPDKIVVAIATGLQYSIDGGETFTAYDNIPTELENTLRPFVLIHPLDENEIWFSTREAGGVFRTKDNGRTWEKMDKGLNHPETGEKMIVNRFFFTGNEKNAMYAIASVFRPLNNGYNGLRGRILYRDDTTDGWIDFSEGLPPVISVNRLIPFYKEGVVRIATNNGIWERDLKDKHFRPIAQPLILNTGKADNLGEAELKFDSYSIVNQNDATWKWDFNPQPLYVSDPTVRNPTVRIAADQSYDVTLTITTPQGTHSKTVKRMIAGKKNVVTGIVGQEKLRHDVLIAKNVYRQGENITLTPEHISQDCQWKLYNAAGQVVDTRNVAATGTTQIATEGLTPGVYFYLLSNTNFRKAGRIIIK